MENVIDECSVAHEERLSLSTLKRRQDEIFKEEDVIDIIEILRECQSVRSLERIITGTLSRNIFHLRNNYLKLRFRSKYEEEYLRQMRIERNAEDGDLNVSETYMDFLRNNNIKIDLEVIINYPEDYPYVRPDWKIKKFHSINVDDENIKYYLNEKINNHNILNNRSWSPVIDLKADIKNFIVSISDIWNIAN